MDRQIEPSVTKEQASEALNARFGEHFVIPPACYFEYWAYPQVFGSTAGPFKGKIAGQAMTTFTIEAWAVDNLALIKPKYEKAKARLEWCKEQEKLAAKGRYYVYVVFVEAKAVYIGKGKGDRYKHAVSGISSCLELNRDFFQGKYIEVRFLEKYLTEEKALKQEEFWISHLKALAQFDCFGHGWEVYNKCKTLPECQFDIGEDYIYHVASSFAISHGAEKVEPEKYDHSKYH